MSQRSTGLSRHERLGGTGGGNVSKPLGAEAIQALLEAKAAQAQLGAEAAKALLRLYSFPELKTCWGVPFNRPRLREKIAEGLFPPPIRVSDNRVAWPGERLLAWRQSLIKAAYEPKKRTDPAAKAKRKARVIGERVA